MPSGARLAGTATRGILRLAREHTAMALTLGYVLLTVVGATYEFSVLMLFRINVLQYADPADFLLAVVRQPVVMLFTALPFGLLWVLDQLNRGLFRILPAYRRSVEKQRLQPRYEAMTNATYVAFIIVYFLAFTLYYAQFVAGRLRAGQGRPVRVALQAPGVDRSQVLEGTLLGTTSRWLFVYRHTDSTAHVVPTESVSEMTVLRRPRGRRQ